MRKILAGVGALSLVLGVLGPVPAFAATTPSLGAAAGYGVLSTTYTNTSAATTINGSVGFTIAPAQAPLGVHPNYGSGAPYSSAGTAQGAAASALATQPCTFTFGGGAIDLSTDTTHGPIGVYGPGVYCSSGAMDVGGPLTLNGAGTYIFRPGGALTSTAGAVVSLIGGASACNVFWTPVAATTLAANTTFFGTVIDDAGITVGANTVWTGRALAFASTVTTGDTVTITAPTCAAPSVSGPTTYYGSINVLKTVINDNGGTKTVADFPLFVSGTPVLSGETNLFVVPADTYVVTEGNTAGYTQTFSGDCSATGEINLNTADNMFCIITNNDIGAPVVVPPVPPLIDVLKVPSPLALPLGPGLVTYTYTARNIGTVPMSNVTMVGDSCSPLSFVSGDLDGDFVLDVNEAWVYTCVTTLTETHTNTVVATGWANGLSAVDVASATVVVGVPLVPPLIHLTKVPSPLSLAAGGGLVTYTEQITNPGTVPLSNVTLSDDRCSPVTYNFGDSNNNALLDMTETWTYTCQQNLAATTTNVAVASGQANGFTVRDFAIATVVVAGAVPALPNTGFEPLSDAIVMSAVAVAAFMGLLLLYAFWKKPTV